MPEALARCAAAHRGFLPDRAVPAGRPHRPGRDGHPGHRLGLVVGGRDRQMVLGVAAPSARAKRFEKAFWSGQPMDDINERVTEKPAEAMARVFSAGAREWRESRRGLAG